jgi:homoserine O-acetyltransferase
MLGEDKTGKVAVRLKWTLSFVFLTMLHAAAYPVPTEADWIARNFKFTTGATLPELRVHYTTIGKPERDGSGKVVNAVLILHGTGGAGRGFLTETFGGQLFGAGQLLDGATHYIILPDGIGHGGSSKPSDGLRMSFPKYTYDDMVRAQYFLLTEGLGVNHLRLVLGTSMGAMHTWLWGETYPRFMDALMPLASAPVEIAGRNWMQRQMRINCIKGDPKWKGGDYTEPPILGLTCVSYIRSLMTSGALRLQEQYPTRESVVEMMEKNSAAQVDANDVIYEMEASRFYNPAPQLDKIEAPLLAINSADDEINPPELRILEREIKKVKRGRFVLLPITDQTRGHGTHSLPAIWGKYLAELLDESR